MIFHVPVVFYHHGLQSPEILHDLNHGQRGQRHSADDRTYDRTQPADHNESDVLDRRQDTKLGRIDEADDAGEQAAGETGKGGVERKRDHLDARDRNAERLRSKRALPHGIEGAAVAHDLSAIDPDLAHGAARLGEDDLAYDAVERPGSAPAGPEFGFISLKG